MNPFTRRKLLSTGLIASGALIGGAALRRFSAKQSPPQIIQRHAAALGTKVHITVHHHDRADADHAIDQAFAELNRVEEVLSIYQPQSDVSRLNRDGAIDNPHQDFLTVLHAALDMSRQTNGAFDCTIQPVWAVHAKAMKDRRTIDPMHLAAARKLVGWSHIECSPSRVAFKQPGMAITFNGIAQGFATDRVREVLSAHGITSALIDVGELSALGDNGGDKPWRVGIQHPREADAFVTLAALNERSMATSGDYESTFSADFNSHHILDPTTGHSPQELASVSIVAPSAMLADALSTAVFVLGAERGEQLLQSMDGVDGLFVFKTRRVRMTPNFPQTA